MSKLRYISKSLYEREDIRVLSHLVPKDVLSNTTRAYNVFLEIAPRDGLYTAEELQRFMMGLVSPNMKPQHTRNFSVEGGILYMGSLEFHEKIGTIEKHTTEVLTSTDNELREYYGFLGQKVFERKDKGNFWRHTTLNIFPSEEVWRDIEDKKLKVASLNGISLKALKKYTNPQRKGFLQRLLNK